MRRRNYVVNRKHQFKFIFLFAITGVCGALVSALYVINDISKQIDYYINQPTMKISSTGEIILPVVLQVSVYISIAMFFIILGLSAFYLKYAKRLGTSLDNCLGKYRTGDMTCHCELLASDFAEASDAFESMLESTRTKMADVKEAAEGIYEEAVKLEAVVGDGADIEDPVKLLEARLKKMEAALSGFVLEAEEQ